MWIMSGEKFNSEPWKKAVTAKEINDMEGSGTVNEHVAQNEFRRLKEEFSPALKTNQGQGELLSKMKPS